MYRLLFCVLLLASCSSERRVLEHLLDTSVQIYRVEAEESHCSGVSIDPRHIVTNAHCVWDNTVSYEVRLRDQRRFAVELVGTSKDVDVAVFRVKEDVKLPYVQMGTSAGVYPGQRVFAVGNPMNMGWSITRGVISAAEPRKMFWGRALQHDALINPGSSGSGLFDESGRLIALNNRGGMGFGFGVPVDIVKAAVEIILKNS